MPRLPFHRSCLVAGITLFITLQCASPAFAGAGCPADVNSSGQVNVDDLLAVINGWGPCSGCAADVTGNGSINVDDLLAVVNGWGACACLPQDGCVNAQHVWCDDWETVDYDRWTGGYDADTNCETMGFSTSKFVSPTHSHKSTIVCATPNSHRGYGGLRFQGDTLLPNFSTPSSGGINAPNGVVVTFWVWLNVPYTFNSTKWLSLMSVTHDCSNNWASVITLNIDDPSMRLKPVHVSSVSYAPGAPAMPLQQWVRIRVYINYNTGSMHVWQNGVKVVSATFSRPVTTLCQWHWGLYASGPNDNVTLYEEDLSIVRLLQPMTNFTVEPSFNVSSPCGP